MQVRWLAVNECAILLPNAQTKKQTIKGNNKDRSQGQVNCGKYYYMKSMSDSIVSRIFRCAFVRDTPVNPERELTFPHDSWR